MSEHNEQFVLKKGKSSANIDEAEDSQMTLDVNEHTKFYDDQGLLKPHPPSETGPSQFPPVEDDSVVEDVQNPIDDDSSNERRFPSLVGEEV